jgi:hypothetical protein
MGGAQFCWVLTCGSCEASSGPLVLLLLHYLGGYIKCLHPLFFDQSPASVAHITSNKLCL